MILPWIPPASPGGAFIGVWVDGRAHAPADAPGVIKDLAISPIPGTAPEARREASRYPTSHMSQHRLVGEGGWFSMGEHKRPNQPGLVHQIDALGKAPPNSSESLISTLG